MLSGKLVLLVIAVLLVDKSRGCSCVQRGALPSEYCSSELVYRGSVVNKTMLQSSENLFHGKVLYAVEVKRVYKTTKSSQSKVDGKEVVFLKSPVYSSFCGVTLTDGVEYLFLFDKWAIKFSEPDAMTISSCDWHRPYNSITSVNQGVLDQGGFEC